MDRIVREQLAIDLNGTVEDLDGETDGFVFLESGDREGRRPFPRGDRGFDMVSMGRAIVVSAPAALLPVVRKEMEGRTRDEAFSSSFVFGVSLGYLPDLASWPEPPFPDGFACELVERAGIPELYAVPGFRNALCYDLAHPRPDVLAAVARSEGRIVAMAGASADSRTMWQIGIDVLPEFRSRGLAAALVNRLAREVLDRGFVPYYGTAASNVASQGVAHRAGFRIVWVSAYQGRCP